MIFTSFSIFQLIFFMVAQVMGSGKFSVNFKTYSNIGDKKFNGECCDGESVGNACSGKCDYSIKLCLGDSPQNPCSIGQLDIGSAGRDSSSFSFDAFFPSAQPNPVPLTVETWPGVAYVTVNISDADSGQDELVDIFQKQVLFPSPIHGRRPFTNEYAPYTAVGQRFSSASSHFYTDDCSVSCIPSDDCQGHYACAQVTGRRVCDDGWKGINCDVPIDSHSCGDVTEKCLNGGTCVRYGNGSEEYYCCCPKGFDGLYCTNNIDECRSSPCMNSGQCVDGIGIYHCNCPSRYTGRNCEKEITCDDKPCYNGGTCVSFPFTGVSCLCDPQFTGFTCEERLTTTAESVTTTLASRNTTTMNPSMSTTSPDLSTLLPVCPPYYFGYDCSVYCRPTNNCNGHYFCDIVTGRKNCLTGWSGDNCTDPVGPLDNSCLPACKNGGVCFNSVCCCPEGRGGSECQLMEPFCKDSTCLNGGVCRNTAAGYQCTCEGDFTGRNCETYIFLPLTTTDVGLISTVTPPIICRDGLHLPDSNTHNNIVCPGNKCRNGGECTNGSCCCREGFTGKLCHVEVLECESQPCMNGGICVDNIGMYECICPPNYTGEDCEISMSPTGSTSSLVTPCDKITCYNGGTCVNDPINLYICLCSDGYVGSHCETKMYTNSTDPTPRCPQHFYGPLCSVYCKPEDSCDDGHYYCGAVSGTKVCKNGWYGRNCDSRYLIQSVDPECPVVKCKNDGICFQGTCCCRNGFVGQYCEEEVVACLSNPCSNGGTCIDTNAGYQCVCRNSTSGVNCEFPTPAMTTPGVIELPCSFSPCKNFGTCIPIGRDDFRCVCNAGYTGSVCEEIVTLVSTAKPDNGTTGESVNSTTRTDIIYTSSVTEAASSMNTLNTSEQNTATSSVSVTSQILNMTVTPETDVSPRLSTTIFGSQATTNSLISTTEQVSSTLSYQPTTTLSSSTTTEPMPSGSIYITGNLDLTASKETLESVINQAVLNLTNETSCIPQVRVDDQEFIFINAEGNPVIKIKYYLMFENCSESNRTILLTSDITDLVHKHLTEQEPFKTNGNSVYLLPESTLVDPRVLISVFFVGFISDKDVELIPNMLQGIWESFNSDVKNCPSCDFKTFIMSPDKYIGDYGMQLTRLRYAAYLDGNSLTSRSITHLSDSFYNGALITCGISSLESIYEGNIAVPYSSYYSVDLSSVVAPNGKTGKQLKANLIAAWKQYAVDNLRLCSTTASCEIEIDFAKAEKYFDNMHKKEISRVSYSVNAAGQPLDAKFIRGPPANSLKRHNIPICECYTFPEYTLSVVEKTKLEDDFSLQHILTQVKGVPVSVQSKQYFSTIYGQNITELWTDMEPKQNMEAYYRNLHLKLIRASWQTPNISYSAVYYFHVTNMIENIELDNLATGLSDAWQNINDHVPKNKFKVKELRMVSGYISKEGLTPLTRIYYEVKVAGVDSKYVNVGEPANDVLWKSLGEKNIIECRCIPLREHEIFLLGIVDPDKNKTEIENALSNAWKKANPDFTGNLNITIHKTDNTYHGSNGETLVKALYTVEPVNKNIKEEDLKIPNENTIQNSFNKTMPGIDIYNGEVEKEEEPEEEWWPILLAILLVLLVIIIAIIIVVFLYRRYRNRESRTLRQKPEEIVAYDKEHFSSKPDFSKSENYENPVFCYEEADDNEKSSTYFVNGTRE